jgi:16S rRNA (uracil1498-N3)-methyltransferase
MRRFFIEQSEITGQMSSITGSDARHIKNVLRLKPGDKIKVFDGAGCEYESKIESYVQNKVTISILKKAPSRAEPPVKIIVAQAFLKDKKMDTIVRQLTELGVSKWIPFMAERSIPKPDKKRLSARGNRWKKIAKEALKQCERGCLPEICSVVSFEDLLCFEKDCDIKIIFYENETKAITPDILSPVTTSKKILVVFGPEGGFTKDEIEKAKACGFVSASLGPRILKADTASVAACTLIQYLFGDMGNKSS